MVDEKRPKSVVDNEKSEEKGEINKVDEISDFIAKINTRYFDKWTNKPRPVFKSNLVYDSTSDGLEPMYFWILDFMKSACGLKVEKLVDNFTSAPGSGYFAELGARATRMQEEAMKILASVNTVIKSIINIIYDLKEFEIRMSHYKLAQSKNKEEKQAGILALKQIWMDNVDIKKGNTSLKAMTFSQTPFTTLLDAFMAADTIEDADNLVLNERVKRILKPRIAEFYEWWKRSESEIKKRFEIEKAYLKSQVNSLKLYAAWVKPYLKAAEQLTGKSNLAGSSPDLINTFNTMILELAIMGVKGIDIQDEAYNKNIPEIFLKVKKNQIRDYFQVILVDFKFRSIPRRVSEQGHYAFGGRAEIDFVGYVLNEQELQVLKNELEKSDVSSMLNLADGVTKDSLDELKDDIDKYLKDEEAEEKKKKENKETENPFAALFSFAKKAVPDKDKKKKDEEAKKKWAIKDIKKETFYEGVIRKYLEPKAAETTFKVFETLKKAYGMPTWFGGLDITEHMQERDNPRQVKKD
jgi:hypothetical protein